MTPDEAKAMEFDAVEWLEHRAKISLEDGYQGQHTKYQIAAIQLRVLRRENEELRKALRSLEWTEATEGDQPGSYCVFCMSEETEGHTAGCRYAEAKALTKGAVG